ncbi:MAG: DNA mismatch repair protein MutS2 [Planctomycetota bacterium]|jgi:DNA mismatch repair protein MutS2
MPDSSPKLNPDPKQMDRPGRERFAAGVLELDSVLEMFAEQALSSLGRRSLEDLEPREDLPATQALQRCTEAMELSRRGESPNLAGLADPFPRSTREARILDEADFSRIRELLGAAERLEEWFSTRTLAAPELCAVVESIPRLQDLAERIDRVVDERGKVRRDASDLLGRTRRMISKLTTEIDTSMRTILRRTDVRAVLSDGSVHRRGSRPVLAVKARLSGRVKGIVHDRSQSGESAFIEPREVIEPGNRLASLLSDERREVERVLLELTRSILADKGRIDQAAAALGEIELAVLSARFCAVYAARPALLPGQEHAAPGLLLRSACHPLLLAQQALGEVGEVVPIDLRVGEDFDMLIITGPNTGGKTLALKTAGLFALLTRMGLPVPAAEGTTVPLYDRVAADIGDEQEISQNLSTFASHLVRIRSGLELATENSLVLLDELGGGTDPDEGAALGAAVLESYLKRGTHVLVSTHISKLKEFAFRNPRAENASTEFDLATLEPRYCLQVGTPGESGALIIARRFGLPESVVKRAEERTERRDGEIGELMRDVRDARLEAERVRSDAEQRLEDVNQLRRDMAEEESKIARRSDQLEAEAQKGLEERVREAARQVQLARDLLPQLPKDVASKMETILNRLGGEVSGASLTDRRTAFLDTIKKGSLVYLPRYRQRVLVHKLNREKREVTCKLGSMKVTVTFDEITPYESL